MQGGVAKGEGGGGGGRATTAVVVTELKMIISRRELEELTRKMEAETASLSPTQVVACLLKVVGDRHHIHQRTCWRPALQSIPEVL